MRIQFFLVLAHMMAIVLWACTLWAADPAAIVEEVSSDKMGIHIMEYLETGRTIHIPGDARIVLGYLRSCRRETITGGSITVGQDRSVVKDGAVETEWVECDGGRMLLAMEQARESSATAIRDLMKDSGDRPLEPGFVIYNRSPLVTAPEERKIIIERLDQSGERYEKEVENGRLDCYEEGIELNPGSVYLVRCGFRSAIFQVALSAMKGEGPFLGRLIRFHMK